MAKINYDCRMLERLAQGQIVKPDNDAYESSLRNEVI